MEETEPVPGRPVGEKDEMRDEGKLSFYFSRFGREGRRWRKMGREGRLDSRHKSHKTRGKSQPQTWASCFPRAVMLIRDSH